MNIKSKLIISYILLIVLSVSFLGFLTSEKSRDAVFNEVTEKSERIAELIHHMVSVRNNLIAENLWTDIHLSKKILNSLGEIRIDETQEMQVGNYILPSLYAGDTNLTIDSSFIDEIKESIGAIASVFILKDDQLIRISTNLMIHDKRAIGTCIPSTSHIYEKIVNNESYYGKNLIQEDWLITGYEPLLDKNGKVVGAIALGYRGLNDYLEKTLNDIVIGETGYVYVMNSKGDSLLHPTLKGKKLPSYDFSKEIIKNKNGLIEYEFDGVYKLAAYRYFEPWDWYIVATANYDDLKSSSKSILHVTLLAGLGISFIFVILALFLANTFVRPINKLKKYMEIAGKGDLTVHSDINSKDEIGVLSDSFNNMIKENKRLLEEVIQYDQLKTEFFSNISHELKTPLNIIFSTTQLFSLYTHDDNCEIDRNKLNKHMDLIKQNCYRLLRLVNNLIDITKIDSGFMQLNLKSQNIVEVVENITLSTVEYVQSKERTILFDTDVEEKNMAFDPEKIERIMLNLISNAVKFTNSGDDIEVAITDQGENILITVKDTGIGIPKDKKEKIFERFKQVDPLLSRNHEGSGIGLSLVKSLVEMHEGNISVDSILGKGTTFMIQLPVKNVSTEEPIEASDDFKQQTNVEKIQIEFSDIYG